MGGRCVDTNEDVGPPLTQLVHTWVGVAGDNYGSQNLCAPQPLASACNSVTGGCCNSAFINNVNSKFAL